MGKAIKVTELPPDEDEEVAPDTAPETGEVLEGDNRPPVYREGDSIIFRASGLSMCESALVAILQGITPSPPPRMLMEKFAEGHQMEPIILGELERRGWVIRARQGAVDIFVCEMEDGTKVYIRGSYDALACWNPDKEPDDAGNLYRDDLERRVVDAKAMGKTYWLAFQNRGPAGLPSSYDAQLTVYMAGTKLPGLWAVGEKYRDEKTGEVDILQVEEVRVDKPPMGLGLLKVKVKRIVKQAETGVLPECATKQWPCPVWQEVCGEEAGGVKLKAWQKKPQPPAEVVKGLEERVEFLANRMAEVKALVKTLEAENREITAELLTIFEDFGVSIPATPETAGKKGVVTGAAINTERWAIEEVRRWTKEYTVQARESRYYQVHKLEGEGADGGTKEGAGE